jgi:hypothetical protein
MARVPSEPLIDSKGGKRFGAAELFGQPVQFLSAKELRRLATANHRDIRCPFKPSGAPCHKKGGVCSLAQWQQSEGVIRIVGEPVTTCPSRFLESGSVFQWVGKMLLGTDHPLIVSELSFLMGGGTAQEEGKEDEVGRIDNVLVRKKSGQLEWCALEMQSVYFSGGSMQADFSTMRTWSGPGFPFPTGRRRPDFRSSGPKRLMPQLQIKVPTLRRWGKKMAVVVDLPFWNSLGAMKRVPHISNADIVWFVVRHKGPSRGRYRLALHDTVATTLEDAVGGLTGGTPVSLEQFEASIRRKLASV